MSTQVTVDIVIVNYQCADEVSHALEALGTWSQGVVWLIDNNAGDAASASDSLALEALAANRTDVCLLKTSKNLGFGGGCNLAFSRSQADLLLLLNPDARIHRESIARLIEEMTKRPKLGAIAPSMFWNDSLSFLIPHSVRQTPMASLLGILATRWGWLARWKARHSVAEVIKKSQFQQAFDVDFLTGAVLLVRRVAALQAATAAQLAPGSLFDPDYFMFFEDSDFSLRLRRAGWVLSVHPKAQAIHSYRHKPYKSGLMSAARIRYFKKQFPVFFRWSGQLAHLDALSRAVEPRLRFESIEGVLSSARELREKTDHAAVLALSPTLVAWPAFVSSPEKSAEPLTEQDWALLEPGHYVAWVQAKSSDAPQWIHFVRSENSTVV